MYQYREEHTTFTTVRESPDLHAYPTDRGDYYDRLDTRAQNEVIEHQQAQYRAYGEAAREQTVRTSRGTYVVNAVMSVVFFFICVMCVYDIAASPYHDRTKILSPHCKDDIVTNLYLAGFSLAFSLLVMLGSGSRILFGTPSLPIMYIGMTVTLGLFTAFWIGTAVIKRRNACGDMVKDFIYIIMFSVLVWVAGVLGFISHCIVVSQERQQSFELRENPRAASRGRREYASHQMQRF